MKEIQFLHKIEEEERILEQQPSGGGVGQWDLPLEGAVSFPSHFMPNS